MARRPRTELDGSTVMVTGASGGIGHAIARRLAARGAKLLLTGRRGDVLAALANELDARVLVCDLADREDVERLADEALGAAVDVLVANAALPATGELHDFTVEQIDRMLDVNLRAPIVLTHRLAPMMTERGGGHLVYISSLSGQTASPASSMYSATKFGLRGFALGLRADLQPAGVGVSVVLPGFIRDAGMFSDARMSLPRGVGTRSPEDVADGVIRAIERDTAEVYVAPLSLRLGAAFGSVAPAPAAAASRLMGGTKVATELAAGQRDKR